MFGISIHVKYIRISTIVGCVGVANVTFVFEGGHFYVAWLSPYWTPLVIPGKKPRRSVW
jgi:hypothetical protein